MVSMVLAGGIALGAYEAGAYAALSREPALRPDWLAASSIGSVNAAIIAGTAPDASLDALTRFWRETSSDPFRAAFPFGLPYRPSMWRHLYNRVSVFETLVFGQSGVFRPRLWPVPRAGVSDVSALYDLRPLGETLRSIVDFDRLNDGPIRVSLATTDVTTGERIVFDNRHGSRIAPEHVLASCALLPLFAPIEVEGRLLGDGAFSSNTPIDLVLDGTDDYAVCFAVDLFAREGRRPHGIADVLSRAGDLTFGNQTRRILDGRTREYRQRHLIHRLLERLPPDMRADAEWSGILDEIGPRRATVLLLSFRAGLDEAGPMKGFDFSRQSIGERWRAGEADMAEALRVLRSVGEEASEGLRTYEVRSTGGTP